MRKRVFGLAMFMAVSGVALWTQSSVPSAQTVGWCAANPGNVFRIGRDRFFNVVFPYQYTGNLNVFDGGTNTRDQCTASKAGLMQWDTPPPQGSTYHGLTSYEICRDYGAYTVDNTLDNLLWNPNGRQAYIDNVGTEQIGQVNSFTNCCNQWQLNCL